MADVLAEAADKIKTELAAIKDEIGRLEEVLVHLGERPEAGSSRPRRGSQSGRRRAKRGEREAQLLKAIQEKPGQRPSEYARELGVADSQVHSLLKKLVDQRKIIRNVKNGIQPLPF